MVTDGRGAMKDTRRMENGEGAGRDAEERRVGAREEAR